MGSGSSSSSSSTHRIPSDANDPSSRIDHPIFKPSEHLHNNVINNDRRSITESRFEDLNLRDSANNIVPIIDQQNQILENLTRFQNSAPLNSNSSSNLSKQITRNGENDEAPNIDQQIERCSAPNSSGTTPGQFPNNSGMPNEQMMFMFQQFMQFMQNNNPNSSQQPTTNVEQKESDCLMPCSSPFTCPTCLVDFEPNEGVVIKKCSHTFCHECLSQIVNASKDNVRCPQTGCKSLILSR